MSTSEDATVRLWDMRMPRRLISCLDLPFGATSLDFSAKRGGLLALNTEGSQVLVLRVSDVLSCRHEGSVHPLLSLRGHSNGASIFFFQIMEMVFVCKKVSGE